MTYFPRFPSILSARRIAALLAGLALTATALAGCGSEGATTDCNLDACTVTFERDVQADVSILGVDAELVGVQGDQATVEVAGQRLTLTVGQQATEVAGLAVTLDSITETAVKVRITRGSES